MYKFNDLPIYGSIFHHELIFPQNFNKIDYNLDSIMVNYKLINFFVKETTKNKYFQKILTNNTLSKLLDFRLLQPIQDYYHYNISLTVNQTVNKTNHTNINISGKNISNITN